MNIAIENESQNVLTAEKNIEAVEIGGSKGYLFIKRAFDIIVSLLAGIILLIPMIIVGIIIKLDSKGPAVFKQERLGKDGKPFIMYKFRTMTMDAPSDMPTLDFINSGEYITRLGVFLRKTSIDEIPQLINIIKGDMTVVGYRPVCLTEEKLNNLRGKLGVLKTKPGLTGLAQINGRDDITYVEKAYLDAEYVQNMSFVYDIKCIIRTFEVVLTGRGAK